MSYSPGVGYGFRIRRGFMPTRPREGLASGVRVAEGCCWATAAWSWICWVRFCVWNKVLELDFERLITTCCSCCNCWRCCAWSCCCCWRNKRSLIFWIPGGKGPGCPGRWVALESGEMFDTEVDVSLLVFGRTKAGAEVAGVVGVEALGVEFGGVTGGEVVFSLFCSACKSRAACDWATRFDMKPVWPKAVSRSRAACCAAKISRFDLNSSNVLLVWSAEVAWLTVGSPDSGEAAEPRSEAISWRIISGLSAEFSSILPFSSDSNITC